MSQPPKTIVVDAYNLLRKLPQPNGRRGDLESARADLEAKIRWYLSRQRGVRLILVYDGRHVGQPTRQSEGGLEIRFSRPPRTADDLVLELARRLEGSTDVTVVTSDMADIGNRLAGLRVRLWTSQEFARRLAAVHPSRDTSEGAGSVGEKPMEIDEDEARTWVEEFGFGSFDRPDGDVENRRGRTPGERGPSSRKRRTVSIPTPGLARAWPSASRRRPPAVGLATHARASESSGAHSHRGAFFHERFDHGGTAGM